jgi:stage II sporulation protein D
MIKKTRLYICLLLLVVIPSVRSPAQGGSPLVRVAVVKEADLFRVSIDGRYTLKDHGSGQVLLRGARLRSCPVTIKSGHISMAGKTFEAKKILVEPGRNSLLGINRRHFRGAVLIVNNNGENLTVVNLVELEQYIRGVLYHEISDKWPLEAIKAQAVATRTYALNSVEKFAQRDYDMTSDIYSQVYGGRSSERYRTSLAVSRTRGEVLTYNGKIFPAFFHANSGGMTEDARELWDIDLPPLRGNIVSPFSVDAPHYRWKVNLRLKDIQDKLNAAGFDLGLIRDIKVVERNKSGRVTKLLFTMRDGRSEVVKGKEFREVLGPNVLKSSKYEIEMKGWYVDFLGNGWGHGVGMCQWGAYGMALNHYNYKEILKFYYPYSRLDRWEGLPR